MKANAVCQHCILGNSQLVLQCALCSGKYAVKQQAEWHSRNHSYIPSEKKLVHILFYMEKALRGFFWNAMLQPQELFGTTRSTCVVQAPLHTGVLSFPTRQYKETFEYSWSRWSHLFFFFFHLFLIHAGTRLTPCPLAAPLLSSWIQNSHMLGVPRQTTILYCHKAIKCLKIPFIFI